MFVLLLPLSLNTSSDFVMNKTKRTRIMQATLDESFYELAGELVYAQIPIYSFKFLIYILLSGLNNYFVTQVRFLLRSGREYDPPASDSEKLSPRFLGYFSVPSSFRRQSVEPKRRVSASVI